MALQAVSVTGYRAFSCEAKLSIRPITLVYGYNSAGKSSLIRLLPLIGASIRTRSPDPFSIMAPVMRGATAVDLFTKGATPQNMSLRFEFDGGAGLAAATYSFIVLERTRNKEVVVDRLKLERSNGDHFTLALVLPRDLREEARTYRLQLLGERRTISGYSLTGFLPNLNINDDDAGRSKALLGLEEELLALRSLVWLGPLRSTPPRIERDTADSPAIDQLGAGASALLSQDDAIAGPVFAMVRGWFQRHTGYTLHIIRGAHEFGALRSVAFSPKDDLKKLIPVEDTGEGIAQVLPTLTAAALASNGRLGPSPTVVVEHPDLHLHSTVHSDLLRYFIDASRTGARFVLETHSEAMLIGIQAAILDKEISPSDVMLHWVRSASDGSATVSSITFDEDGYPMDGNWPIADWYSAVHKEMQRLSSRRLAP